MIKDGDIMGSQIPEGIHIPADRSQVGAASIKIIDLAHG
jgi:hypothetical protein